VEVNKSNKKVLYYDSFIDLIKQPNRIECIKYFFENKTASINDVVVLNEKQLLDMTYDDVLAEYLHLDMDKITIKKCVYYSKKNSNVEPNDVIYIINLGLEDIEPTKQFLDLIHTDFFMPTRLERYMKLYEKNNDYTSRQIVEIVNCDADQEFYTNIMPADLSKGVLILCNKFYCLPSDYEPANLVRVDKKYTIYDDVEMVKDAYDALEEMSKVARDNLLEIKIIGRSAYRDYDFQRTLYNRKKKNYGLEIADISVARPGHSEHQTGLSVDIRVFPLEGNNTYTKMFDWTKEHCWEYGFICRYQGGKEHLTGFYKEDWHYRYVGKEVALFIKEHDITFDEYYNYFVKGY
ncbi:MAG: M15 family metallopeptidase, partial [Erysipelotrichia bacterium]|nr:M15 family metallopeptidase [Erysipelotrichia bacterium]